MGDSLLGQYGFPDAIEPGNELSQRVTNKIMVTKLKWTVELGIQELMNQ